MPQETQPSEQFYPAEIKFRRKVSKNRVPSGRLKMSGKLGKGAGKGAAENISSSVAKLGASGGGRDSLDGASDRIAAPGVGVNLDYDKLSGSTLGSRKK